jgi:cyanophycin synthetase
MSTPQLNASSRIMYEEAQKMGISCTTFGDKETILMEKDGKQWYTRGSRTSLQSSVGKSIADYKPLTKQILQHFKLPTSNSVLVRSAEDFSQVEQLHFPLVMKPVDERHGTGVKTGVQSIEEVKNNVKNFPVLIEEMLEGTEYRILCVDFTFVAAAFRKPAHVVGDGRHTIAELIEEKNQHPWRSKGHQNNLTTIEVDEEVTTYLKEQGFDLTSVPAQDQEVLLRHTANLSTGGEAWDVSAEVSEENKKLFEEIARVCDLNVIGIDVMCQSLSTPISTQPKAGIIEVNASPGLRMHHYPMKGEPKNIAHLILQSTLQKMTL